jgi:hypothetical protein
MAEEQGESFMAFFRQKSTGVVFPHKIIVKDPSEDVVGKAEEIRQAGFKIGPEDIEVWEIFDGEGRNVFKGYQPDQLKEKQEGG